MGQVLDLTDEAWLEFGHATMTKQCLQAQWPIQNKITEKEKAKGKATA